MAAHLIDCLFILLVALGAGYFKCRVAAAAGVVFACGSIALYALRPLTGMFYLDVASQVFPAVTILLLTMLLVNYQFRNRERVTQLEQELSRLEESSSSLLTDYQHVKDVNTNLEKRILQGEDYPLKLQEAVSTLAMLDYGEIKNELLRIIIDFISARSVVFYSWSGKEFIRDSFSYSPERVREVLDDSLQATQVLMKDGLVTLKELPEEEQDIILGGRLTSRSGECLGAVIITDLDLLDLNSTNIRLFRMLCNWASIEIEKSKSFENLQFNMVKMHNFRYYLQTFYHEILEVKSGDHVSTILTVFVKNRQDISDAAYAEIMSTISSHLYQDFPDANIFYNELRNDRFHILFSGEQQHEVEIKGNRFICEEWIKVMRPYQTNTETLKLSISSFYLHKELSDAEINAFVEENSQMS
jgi:hypothetical protein